MRTLLALALTLATGLAHAQDIAPNEPCPSNKIPPIALPRLKEALAANREITIIALGSSSTQGWHSSDIAHSYPALLQTMLNGALPTGHVAVINRGIGGQDVSEMLPRIETDALATKPTVVIWQVGANGAMKHVPTEMFKRMLATGVRRLVDAKVDVILMDNQRAPAILAVPDHIQFDQAMADVAVSSGASLFGRGALMDQWRESGFPYARFMSDDGVHHNDYGYRCVAAALSTAIVDGLKQTAVTRTAAKR